MFWPQDFRSVLFQVPEMLLQTVAATGGWNGVASFTKQVKNSYQSFFSKLTLSKMVLQWNLLQYNLQSSTNSGRRKNALTTESIVITHIKAIQTQNAITTKSIVIQTQSSPNTGRRKEAATKLGLGWVYRVSQKKLLFVVIFNWVYRESQKNSSSGFIQMGPSQQWGNFKC